MFIPLERLLIISFLGPLRVSSLTLSWQDQDFMTSHLDYYDILLIGRPVSCCIQDISLLDGWTRTTRTFGGINLPRISLLLPRVCDCMLDVVLLLYAELNSVSNLRDLFLQIRFLKMYMKFVFLFIKTPSMAFHHIQTVIKITFHAF